MLDPGLVAADLAGGGTAENDRGGIGATGGDGAGVARPAAEIAGDGCVGGGGAVVVRSGQLGGGLVEERVDLC